MDVISVGLYKQPAANSNNSAKDPHSPDAQPGKRKRDADPAKPDEPQKRPRTFRSLSKNFPLTPVQAERIVMAALPPTVAKSIDVDRRPGEAAVILADLAKTPDGVRAPPHMSPDRFRYALQRFTRMLHNKDSARKSRRRQRDHILYLEAEVERLRDELQAATRHPPKPPELKPEPKTTPLVVSPVLALLIRHVAQLEQRICAVEGVSHTIREHVLLSTTAMPACRETGPRYISPLDTLRLWQQHPLP